MVAQTLPMAAMFMKNKLLSWSAFFLAIQSWLNEPINRPADDTSLSTATQPPLLRILFSFISLATCYIEFFFPAASTNVKRVSKAAVDAASATASSIASSTA